MSSSPVRPYSASSRTLIKAALITLAIFVAHSVDAQEFVPETRWATKRANIRSGPGTEHEKVGLLEVGERVLATGEAGNWLEVLAHTTGTGFVYAPLLSTERPGLEFYRSYAWAEGVYNGQVRNERPHGRGLYTWDGGSRYQGDFVGGNFHGRGVATWADGNRYEGDWVIGKRTGTGVFTWADGGRYEGAFVNGRLHGRGTYTRPDGTRHEAYWKNGKRERGGATGADVERAMACVERLEGVTYRNRCDEAVAFHYCFKNTDGHLPTCGKPSVKALHGKPEHYYTHLEYLQPGEAFTVPFAERHGFYWAACPRRNDGAFYHAVSPGGNKFTCRLLDLSVARGKAERSAALAKQAPTPGQAPAPAPGGEGWVAIVDGYRTTSYEGGVLALVAGKRSRGEALDAATRRCRAQGGFECGERSGANAWQGRCIAAVEATFMGQSELYFHGLGETRAQAQRRAQTNCRSSGGTRCSPAGSACG